MPLPPLSTSWIDRRSGTELRHSGIVGGATVGIHRHLRRLHLRRAGKRGLDLQQLGGLLVRQFVARLDRLHLPGGTLRMLLQRGQQRGVAGFLSLLKPQRLAHHAQIMGRKAQR